MIDKLEKTSFDNIVLPETLAKENPKLFTETQITWLVKKRQNNGLADSGAVLKISNKIYINRERFFNWFLKQIAN